MANETYLVDIKTDLNASNLTPVTIRTPLQAGDSNAHSIKITVTKGNENYSMSGMTVKGYFQCKTGLPYMVSGSISGNVATVVIPSSVYAQSGEVIAIIRISSASITQTIGKVTMYVIADVDNSGAQLPSSEASIEIVTKAELNKYMLKSTYDSNGDGVIDMPYYEATAYTNIGISLNTVAKVSGIRIASNVYDVTIVGYVNSDGSGNAYDWLSGSVIARHFGRNSLAQMYSSVFYYCDILDDTNGGNPSIEKKGYAPQMVIDGGNLRIARAYTSSMTSGSWPLSSIKKGRFAFRIIVRMA